MATIHPFLWFDTNAAEARDFYLSVFKNAKALETTVHCNSWLTRIARKRIGYGGRCTR
jgi:predicted 3-demethylubiquinone-9 3-methyltransferase (glyoxalase superfamily)